MKKIIFGNFKMNMTVHDTERYIEQFLPLVQGSKNDVAIFPSFVNLMFAKQKLTASKIMLGAQNVAVEASGAYTGEVSAQMLKSVCVNYVLIGHSERRKQFLEKNEQINKKIKQALGEGLRIVLCVGESKYERQNKKVEQVLEREILDAVKGLYENELKNIIIAYEPIWAIGTGKLPTTREVEQATGVIRKIIKQEYSETASKNLKVLYGGSVNSSNAKQYASISGINGLLVGGASLDAKEFAKIANI